MRLYRIRITGCDDSTTIDMELSPAALRAVEAVAAASASASTYDCMPTLTIKKCPTKKDAA